MVDNQFQINMPLTFGAANVNPVVLEKLLVGREHIAKKLITIASAIARHNNNQYLLIIAKRGMGKTHLLRVFYHQLQEYLVNEKMQVAYLNEEEMGISNYFTFLTRVIFSFIKWNVKDKNLLTEKMNNLMDTQPQNQQFKAEKIIEEYIGKKTLLILAENFGEMLNDIGPMEQGKLRDWLHKQGGISIVATTQHLTEDFDSESRPFYNFFEKLYLKELSLEDTGTFLIKLAELDNRADVADFVKTKGANSVAALHDLVKGNHRLLVTFYEFLKTDLMAKLSTHFVKTINDLKPYYETFVRYLPPQQKSIINFLAQMQKPQQGTVIGRNCFIESNSLSKQLSELQRKKLIEAITDQDDKRNKLYEISEPLLRISIEIAQHKEGVTRIFIDFLALFYSEQELKNKMQLTNQKLMDCEDEPMKQNYLYEIAAIHTAIDFKQTKQTKQRTEAEKYFKAGRTFYESDEFEKALNEYNKSIELDPNWAYPYNYRGNVYYNLEQYDKAIEDYNKATELDPNWSYPYNNRGNVYCYLKQYDKAIEDYNKALELDPNWSYPYNNRGNVYYDLKKYEKAIEDYNKALELDPNYANPYNGRGIVYWDLKQYEKAIEDYKKAIEFEEDARIYRNLNKCIIAWLELGEMGEKAKIESIISFVQLHTKNFPEFEITKKMLEIYNLYVLQGIKKSLNDLPKEQRNFFVKNILKMEE